MKAGSWPSIALIYLFADNVIAMGLLKPCDENNREAIVAATVKFFDELEVHIGEE